MHAGVLSPLLPGRPFRLLVVAVAVALLGGCGTSYRGEVRDLGEAHRWDAAASRLNDVVEVDENDSWAWRQLGVARFNLGDFTGALEALERSDALVADHGETLYYLALAHEGRGDIEQALGYYARCASSPQLSYEARRAAQSRWFHLNRKFYRQRAQRLSSLETSEFPAIEPGVLAVHDFTSTDASRRSDGMRRALAVLIIDDLQHVHAVRLVERLQLQALVDEIERGRTGAIDQETRARSGRLLAAERSVSGTLSLAGGDRILVSYYALRNDSGAVLVEETVAGHLAELMALQKEITWGLLDRLRIPVTEAERLAIGTVATESLPAFLAFAEGILLEDEERYGEAYARFQEAVQIDPGFRQAGERARRLQGVQIERDTPQEFAAMMMMVGIREPAEPSVRRRLEEQWVRFGGGEPGGSDGSGVGDDRGDIPGTGSGPPPPPPPPVDVTATVTIRVETTP
jgi:tetratricopeptide (TPR) repeat protein